MKRLRRGPIRVTRALLRRHGLPRAADNDDKEARGRVLVLGGGMELVGAVALAGEAALRVGAGKLQIATARGIAPTLAVAIPEAWVIGLATNVRGEITGGALPARLVNALGAADAVLIGPGMTNERAAVRLLASVARSCPPRAVAVIDAGALTALKNETRGQRRLAGRMLLTPHAGEMATLLSVGQADVDAAPVEAALEAATRFGAVVALKGATTWIATPEREVFEHVAALPGLATSGSGDVLAGIAAGLACRGASPLTAALWSVALHAQAGRALSRRVGRLGFLARELLAEVPVLLARMD
jgi:ADP-dependent NAD(P)H-hydrate dehydratase